MPPVFTQLVIFDRKVNLIEKSLVLLVTVVQTIVLVSLIRRSALYVKNTIASRAAPLRCHVVADSECFY